MNKLTLTSLLAAGAVVAFADISHEALINLPGGGTGAIAGADLSQLEAGETTFGYGAQTSQPNTMADDFVVGAGGMNVTALRFYMYQTGATTPTITAVNWAVGAAATTTLTTTAATSSWFMPNSVGVFRVSSTSTSDSNRRVQQVDVDVTDFFLAAGTYFVSWNAAGSTSFSGPWQPHNPTSNAAFGQNGLQDIAGGGFNPVDGGIGGVDLPFTIIGDPVPEPATMAVLGLGALALLRRRNKK